MKAIINSLRYNTDTAKLIAQWSNGHNLGDFHWYSEDLYKTKNERFFTAGEGGPLSKYSGSCGSSCYSGEEIRILTKDQAYYWLEEKGCIEAIETEFGDKVEDA